MRAVLRADRTKNVHALLGPAAASGVSSIGPAAAGTYAAGNESMGARAQNRGVVVEFGQDLTMPTEQIEGKRERADVETSNCNDDQVEELALAMPLAHAMVDHAMNVIAVKPPGVLALARKYFNDDSVSTLNKIYSGLREIKEGLARNSQPGPAVAPGYERHAV